MCLAQGHNTVTPMGIETRTPRFGVQCSTTTPPGSLIESVIIEFNPTESLLFVSGLLVRHVFSSVTQQMPSRENIYLQCKLVLGNATSKLYDFNLILEKRESPKYSSAED